ncbi:hypothetical protein [Alkalihalobacillus trypoxylicola]|nr:hypothetical protein [Alkalihalobacillus trypoxylicola]GAF63227.1 hypothetical protein BTS2_0118 [Bacillus sp. TS-2]
MMSLGNRGQAHETLLILVVIGSLITGKKIKKLENYKEKLKGQYYPD